LAYFPLQITANHLDLIVLRYYSYAYLKKSPNGRSSQRQERATASPRMFTLFLTSINIENEPPMKIENVNCFFEIHFNSPEN
jgi:hypothetical protein